MFVAMTSDAFLQIAVSHWVFIAIKTFSDSARVAFPHIAALVVSHEVGQTAD